MSQAIRASFFRHALVVALLFSAHATAQEPLAAPRDLYESGQRALLGFPSDPARAFGLFTQAAAGEPSEAAACAAWQLGMMTKDGQGGVKRDLAAAHQLVAKAAEGGCIPGMISRAVMLATGEGVEEDDQAARVWYERAARSGKPDAAHAMRGLGGMLIFGEGGPADPVLGVGLLQLAAKGSDAIAASLLTDLQPQLTPEILAAAPQAAAEWLRQSPPTL